MDDWSCTKEALIGLKSILQCAICTKMVSDPCSIETCFHHFCRGCVEKALDADRKCPVCDSFAWERDIKSSRQLAHTAALCLQLEALISSGDDEGGSRAITKEKGEYTSNYLENWEETEEGDEEEVNTYAFPSSGGSASEEEPTIDLSHQNNKEASQFGANQPNTDRPWSLPGWQGVESTNGPVFPTIKTYSKGSMKKAGLSGEVTRPPSVDHASSSHTTTVGHKELHSCESGEECVIHSGECGTPLSKVESTTGGTAAGIEAFLKSANDTCPSADCSIGEAGQTLVDLDDQNDEESESGARQPDPKRKRSMPGWQTVKHSPAPVFSTIKIYGKVARERIVLKEVDIHANTHGNEAAETGPFGHFDESEQTPNESGADRQNTNPMFTKVKPRGCSSANDRRNEAQERDALQGGPRIRTNKRRPLLIQDSEVTSDQHGIDQSPAQGTRKKSRHHQRRIENFLVKPGSEKLDTHKTSVGHRNKQGETPLHVAAIKGNLQAAADLLEQGADPNAKDHAGWTPLHEACNHGHAAIAELLLDRGALLDMTGGFDHDTPLHDAVVNGHVQVAKLLVERGASLDIRNKQGVVPKDYAVSNYMIEVFSIDPQSHTRTSPASSACGVQSVSTTTHKVILTTGLSTAQKKQVQTCVDRLGGSCIVREFSTSVTHVVAATDGEGACKRTVKYLHGLVAGKWVVRFEWISKCLRRKQWVDETPFEVVGTNEAKVEAPRRARQNAAKQLPGLFDGCNVFFSGDFKPPCVPRAELIHMVKSGGGKILSREPKPDFGASSDVGRLLTAPTVVYHARPDSEQYRRTQYVIFDPLSERRSRIYKASDAVGWAPVSWLIDCISHFEILDVS